MRTKIWILSLILLFCASVSSAQQGEAWYMETTAFEKFMPGSVQKRYDAINRLILICDMKADRADITMFDLDPVGNILSHISFDLHKDKRNPHKWICYSCAGMSAEQFKELTQKLVDRLKK